jgi:NAD(P)H-dependent flavin oxidoreductase YrpB (nitropropane dioxygenase family)
MVLVPQVIEAVRPIPVVAAGGIFDGRGIAAALMLGAAGVNLGTRFIACRDTPCTRRMETGDCHGEIRGRDEGRGAQ